VNHEARREPTRLSTLAHLAMAGAMVVVLVPLVLRAAQAAPPAIAEFAPQVTQAIRHAPPGQSSAFGGPSGTGPGSGASPRPSQPSPTLAPSPPALVVPPGARVNKCIGDPPRQIEDPQSPPCIPFWDPKQSNGGATAFGVTATAINVAIPAYTLTGAGDAQTMINFFNHRFEFYGRKLILKTFADSGQDATVEAMQADAQKVEQASAFAELTYPLQDGAESIFYDALARLKHPVISVQGAIQSLAVSSEAHLASMAPYEWNYVPTPDVVTRNLGEMICKQLVGRPPSRAGPPTNSAPTRKFGIMREVRAGYPSYDASLLVGAIQACTGQPPLVVDFSSSGNSVQSEVANAELKMSSGGVTSVSCLCQTNLMEAWVLPEAQAQGYQPEWITSNIGDQDGNESLFLAPDGQTAHAMGIRSRNKELPTLDMPYVWAIHYESPDNPKPPYTSSINGWDDWVYDDLLLLASGIQMAGPNLTPATFAAALQRTEFPNPGCDGPPYYQACVGFSDGGHTMQNSFAQIAWDPTAKNPDASGKAGAYCYVAVGVRRSLGRWAGPDRYGSSNCA
jgi:hypothetical protein